jgi:hypothetical protein
MSNQAIGNEALANQAVANQAANHISIAKDFAMTAALDAFGGMSVFAGSQRRGTRLAKFGSWHVGQPLAAGPRAYGAPRVRSAHHASVIIRSRGPAKPR